MEDFHTGISLLGVFGSAMSLVWESVTSGVARVMHEKGKGPIHPNFQALCNFSKKLDIGSNALSSVD